MSLIARENKKEWTQAPEGLHHAVCCDVVDLGMVESPPWGKKHKARLLWQIEEINPDTGKRFEIRADYGLSLSEKSRLRPTLEAWRGRKFTEDELEGFDLEILVGVNCQVQVIHNLTAKGKTYANVQAVVPAPKGIPKLAVQDYIRVKDRPAAGTQSEEAPAHGNDDVPF